MSKQLLFCCQQQTAPFSSALSLPLSLQKKKSFVHKHLRHRPKFVSTPQDTSKSVAPNKTLFVGTDHIGFSNAYCDELRESPHQSLADDYWTTFRYEALPSNCGSPSHGTCTDSSLARRSFSSITHTCCPMYLQFDELNGIDPAGSQSDYQRVLSKRKCHSDMCLCRRLMGKSSHALSCFVITDE